jgi:hypothetical protein
MNGVDLPTPNFCVPPPPQKKKAILNNVWVNVGQDSCGRTCEISWQVSQIEFLCDFVT